MNLVIRALASLFLLISPFFLGWVSADEGREIRWNRPPGILVSVGTHRLHLYCTNGEGPTVILDAGLGGFSLDWYKVQSLLTERILKPVVMIGRGTAGVTGVHLHVRQIRLLMSYPHF